MGERKTHNNTIGTHRQTIHNTHANRQRQYTQKPKPTCTHTFSTPHTQHGRDPRNTQHCVPHTLSPSLSFRSFCMSSLAIFSYFRNLSSPTNTDKQYTQNTDKRQTHPQDQRPRTTITHLKQETKAHKHTRPRIHDSNTTVNAIVNEQYKCKGSKLRDFTDGAAQNTQNHTMTEKHTHRHKTHKGNTHTTTKTSTQTHSVKIRNKSTNAPHFTALHRNAQHQRMKSQGL